MDILISTNKQYSVRQFIGECCKYVGWNIKWFGKGLKEVGKINYKGKEKTIVKVNKKYFRPNELQALRGKSIYADKTFKLKLKYSFKDLVKEMMEYDLKNIK